MTDLLVQFPSLADLTSLDSRVVLGVVERGQEWLLTNGVKVLVTIALALVARWAAHRVIGRVVRSMATRASSRSTATHGPAAVLAGERHAQRVETMGSLLRSVATFVIGVIAALTVLDLVGIPLGPLLASAGVGGVAIGFGAQSLVKDFLSGVFMIFEDQYGVGDVVDTGEAIGTIEEVSLRITRLRDFDGVVWYVRNGEIIRIGNRSQGYGAAWIDMPVSYRNDMDRVLTILREVSEEFAADEEWKDKLIEAPTVLGVDSISGQTVTVKVLAKCLAGEQFAVQRVLRQRIKAAFDANDIQAPPMPPYGQGASS